MCVNANMMKGGKKSLLNKMVGTYVYFENQYSSWLKKHKCI